MFRNQRIEVVIENVDKEAVEFLLAEIFQIIERYDATVFSKSLN